MRKSREEAAQTRQRIIKAASQRFRGNGIAETGLNDLMKAAGLETQGGFYKHFESKDKLLEEAIGYGVAEILGRLEDSVKGIPPEDTYAAVVSNYLSTEHRDHRSHSCPYSAIGTELGRLEGRNAKAAAEGLKKLIALVAMQIKDVPAEQARRRATAAVSAMVGGLLLSRIADSTHWANTILAETRKLILREERSRER
jgi:TetR/AcrR family transcriptional repressor of nem operon